MRSSAAVSSATSATIGSSRRIVSPSSSGVCPRLRELDEDLLQVLGSGPEGLELGAGLGRDLLVDVQRVEQVRSAWWLLLGQLRQRA